MPRGTKRKIETPSVDEKAPKKMKLDLKYDSREENQLPDELVLQLLRQLERSDIVQCTMTCRQWYRVGQRDEFHWTFVTELTAVEFPAAYHFQRNKRLKDYAHLDLEEQIEELKLWQSDPVHSGTPVRIQSKKEGSLMAYMYDDQDTLVAIAAFPYETDFDFNKRNNALLWKYTIEQRNNIIRRREVIDGLRTWRVKLHINLKVLNSMVLEQNCKTIPNADTLLRQISTEWNESSVTASTGQPTFVNRPLKSTVPQRQPDGFKEDINIYKYQLDAITWMKSVEDQIGQDVIYTSAIRWKGSAVYFDPINQKIVHPRNLHQHLHKEQIRGGILADDVGLGKTFEVLGLVLAAPPKSELEPHPVLIASKSTLIMCPEHISKQWHDEITRATNLSVLLVANYEDLKKCTYEDFRSQYDVIVCVYELFASLKYVCLPSRRTKGTLTEVERNNNVKQALEELRTNQNFSEVKAPIIEHFFFHRVVFDEGHQSSKEFCLHRYAVIDLSKNVWGRSKWFVSATPFGSGNLFHFLCLPPLKNTIGYYRAELIYRDYLWRNTKDSVKDEITVPETVDDVHYVELSPIERAIYFNESYETTRDPYHACVTFTYHKGLKSVATIKLANLKERITQQTLRANAADEQLRVARQEHALEQNASRKKALESHLEYLNVRAEFNRKIVNTMRNGIEILEQEIQTLPEKVVRAKTGEEKEFVSLQQRYGSKVAGMLAYLKKLFKEKPNSRVIIFSMTRYLYLEMLLNEYGIMTTSVRGNANTKVQAIEDFKKEMAAFKVIMMDSQENSAGTNMIEATHVLLLDPPAHNQESFETQAIGRAYRQGQTKQITVVRILFKDTFEHANYLKRNNMPLDGLIEYNPETWKPRDENEVRASTNRIAKLGKSSSFSGISAADLKQSLEIQNNTNERKEDNAENGAENDNTTNDPTNANGTKKKKPAPKKKAPKKSTKKKSNNNNDEDENGDDQMDVEKEEKD